MVVTAREPRAYELMAIVVPELADDDLTNQIQKISAHISSATGAIKETLTDSPWGRRRLAYTVRHNSQDYRDGYYIVFHFDLEPSRMAEVERELKLDVNLMRYLLVHDDPNAGEKHPAEADGAVAETSDGNAPVSAPATEEPVASESASPAADEPGGPEPETETGEPAPSGRVPVTAVAAAAPGAEATAESDLADTADEAAEFVTAAADEPAPAAVAPSDDQGSTGETSEAPVGSDERVPEPEAAPDEATNTSDDDTKQEG